MSDHSHHHGHDHGHEHGPSHDHSHSHDEPDTYFIDQLCMVGLSGAFGVICLCPDTITTMRISTNTSTPSRKDRRCSWPSSQRTSTGPPWGTSTSHWRPA